MSSRLRGLLGEREVLRDWERFLRCEDLCLRSPSRCSCRRCCHTRRSSSAAACLSRRCCTTRCASSCAMATLSAASASRRSARSFCSFARAARSASRAARSSSRAARSRLRRASIASGSKASPSLTSANPNAPRNFAICCSLRFATSCDSSDSLSELTTGAGSNAAALAASNCCRSSEVRSRMVSGSIPSSSSWSSSSATFNSTSRFLACSKIS